MENIKKSKLSAVILAAGKSSRMKFPKPLLEIKGKNITKMILDKISAAGIKQVYTVLGAEAERISGQLKLEGINTIINKEWEHGQISSLKTAINEVGDTAAAMMVFLIDHPQVEISTIRKLIKEFEAGDYDIVIPEYMGSGGHPVIFRDSVFSDLMDAPAEAGARAVVKSGKHTLKRVCVEDVFVKQDLDTPEDLALIDV
ncbi:MAG: nucleotidyltransferase family protein [Elusimicrobiota bacterium]